VGIQASRTKHAWQTHAISDARVTIRAARRGLVGNLLCTVLCIGCRNVVVRHHIGPEAATTVRDDGRSLGSAT